MGTRYLTIVKYNNEFPVRQYSQWDGCPSNDGVDLIEYLWKGFDEEKFKSALEKCRLCDRFTVDWLIEKETKGLRKFSSDYWIAIDTKLPEFHTGYEILDLIQESDGLFLEDGSCFGGIEWVYLLDLDDRKLEVYGGEFEEPGVKNTIHEICSPSFCLKKTEFDLDYLPQPGEFLEVFLPYFEETFNKWGIGRVKELIQDYKADWPYERKNQF